MFFAPKDKNKPLKNLVWMNRKAKYEGLCKLIEKFPDGILIAWFNATAEEVLNILEENKLLNSGVKMASNLNPHTTKDKLVVLLEHYPLSGKETRAIETWKASDIFVLNALDEPVFNYFGGENIAAIMKRMGMEEEEMIEHHLIDQSISQAQEKLERLVSIDKFANSQEEWFKKNIPGGIS